MPFNVDHHYLHECGPHSFEATGPLVACWAALLQDLVGLLLSTLRISSIKLNVCLYVCQGTFNGILTHAHCSGCGTMMCLFPECLYSCKNLWMSQIWSLYLHLKYFSSGAHILQKSAWSSALDCLLIGCFHSPLLGICCGSLQHKGRVLPLVMNTSAVTPAYGLYDIS